MHWPGRAGAEATARPRVNAVLTRHSASSQPLLSASGPMGRTPLLAVAVLAVFLPASGAASLSPRGGADVVRPSPSLSNFQPTHALIADRLIAETPRSLLAANVWGGRHTTSTGETVTVFASDAYPQESRLTQSRAEFLGSLVHGSELAEVTVYILPRNELRSACGRGAAGCYSPRDETIVTLGEDIPGGPTADAVLAHEYGHHVATNRLNPPWDAGDWGTKRWASASNVCAGARAGTLFPGDEGRNYTLNPGEAVAESYRLLSERRLGVAESPWNVVDAALYPTDAALQLLQQDVVEPWRANTVQTRRSSFARRGTKTRTFGVATPFDGNLNVRLRAPSGKYTMTLRAGTRVMARTTSRTLSATVCGERTLSVRVVRGSGGLGAFSLTISRP